MEKDFLKKKIRRNQIRALFLIVFGSKKSFREFKFTNQVNPNELNPTLTTILWRQNLRRRELA
jgi:hypothetical protein